MLGAGVLGSSRSRAVTLLRYRADRRTLAIVAAWFALVATQWVTAPRAPLIAVPLVLATCFAGFLGAVATHNAMHCPVFHKPALNRVFQVALTLVYGHPVSAFIPAHNLSHHRYTETSRDVMRTSKIRFRWHLLNLLFFPATIGGDLLRAEWSYARAARKRDPEWFRQLLLETAVLVVAIGALAVVDWRKVLVYVIVPQAYAAWGIVTMNLLQHDGCDPSSEWNHSRNFTGKWVNWWTFNNGFHTIHHAQPGLHWSVLPAEHARLVSPNIHPELEQRSIVAYVVRTYLLPFGRRRFDGRPLTVVAPGVDEDWMTP